MPPQKQALKNSVKKIVQKEIKDVKEEVEKMEPNEPNILAAISYLWLLVFIPFLFARKSPFVRFHANQGMTLLAFELLFGWFPPFWIIFVIVSIVGFIKAMQGEKYELPVIKTIVQKISNT